jgi:diacylglycerol kinase family enzyme
MSDPAYYVLLNANAGTVLNTGVTPELLHAEFEARGLPVTIDHDCDRPFADRIADALASGAGTIVAAGGDGTITTLASALVGTDRNLAILPLGTVNALAKDLNVPLNIPAAIDAMANGVSHRIDVGEVNGRIFLHKVVIGIIPSLAAGREYIRGKETTAAKLAFLRYIFRRLARAKRMAVAIEPSDGPRRIERVQALAVASNSYDEGLGQFFARHSLDRGTLTLYILRRLKPGDFVRLVARMMMGRWRDYDALSMETVQSVTIDTHKTLLKVMFDGDVQTMETPLHFTIRPKALSVLVPAEAEAKMQAEVA